MKLDLKMISYMVPMEEKPPPAPTKSRLALELRDGSPDNVRKIEKLNISKETSTSSFISDLTISSSTPADKPKHNKLLGNGTKQTTFKRVSFGSSKGSMVETLIYESPLQEEPEISPHPQTTDVRAPIVYATPIEDRSERSKVRVSFYQGARPQCVSPPLQEPSSHYVSIDSTHIDMTDHLAYNRQLSTDSGWDNPFRPDGDLSREADEIVSLIKGGKPITPTPTAQPQILEEVQEKNVENLNTSAPASPESKPSKAMNGAKNGAVEIQRSPPQEPQQPEHVTIKKKPKCKCCVIQ